MVFSWIHYVCPQIYGTPKSLILCPLLFWHWGDLLGTCLCADLSSPTWTHQTSLRFGSQFQGVALDEVGHLIFMSKTILELHFGNWLWMHGSSGTKLLDFVGGFPLKLPVIALALCWRFSSIFCISAACLLCPQNISWPLFVMLFSFLGGSYISRKVAPEGLPWVLLYEVKGRAASLVTWLFRRLLVILVPPPSPPHVFVST